MSPQASVGFQKPHFACLSEMKADLEFLVETPVMSAHQFCGKWTNSSGEDVEVSLDEVHHAQLRAILVRKDGHRTFLSIHGTAGGWMCGKAFLVAASNDQLDWEFKSGFVSTWHRCTETHLSRQVMRPEPPAQADESLPDALSDCQSPSERYFNPHPRLGSLRNPTHEFFLPHKQKQSSSEDEQKRGSSEESLTGKVWKMSQKPDGSRKVQEALSKGDNLSRLKIASELQGHVWEAVENPHANYVLQKCIVEMPPEASEFIVDELKSWNGAPAAPYLAKHKFGCRVFERLLEHCPKLVEGMVNELLANVRALSLHPFGNFTVQHILEYGSVEQQRAFATSLLECIGRLCCNDCGVAVIGKALEHAPADERHSIAKALLQDEDRFIQLGLWRFGQVAVKAILSGPEARKARQVLEEHAKQLTTRHGRSVLRLVSDCELAVCKQRVSAAKGGS